MVEFESFRLRNLFPPRLGYTGHMIPANYLFFGNLTWDTDEKMIIDALAGVGTVSKITFAIDEASGRQLGFAFVELASENEVNDAISAINGKNVGGDGGKPCYLDYPYNQADLWLRVFPSK